jgi:hypothetical protein
MAALEQQDDLADYVEVDLPPPVPPTFEESFEQFHLALADEQLHHVSVRPCLATVSSLYSFRGH